ncbi:MAG TPA: hypothetical protein VFW03_28380 [Gemmatimonadaceae bacterium]|nr:hypothetical protein [Gemmatimonadaceae bacterium]
MSFVHKRAILHPSPGATGWTLGAAMTSIGYAWAHKRFWPAAMKT